MTDNLLDGLDLDIEIPDAQKNATTSTASAPQHFFGPYQLIQDVGIGGVAKVMRARHIHPSYAETSFAIKILHDQLSQDPRVVNLFRNEAYVLSMIKHPNIVQTFEAGVQDEKLFIAMEYIDGRDLDATANRANKSKMVLPLPIVMHIMGEVARGLLYAHQLRDADGHPLGLVHRDVNPANVFISYDGTVKLGDFGVSAFAASAVEKSRELAGKVGYFAPEQLSGDNVDQRADQFALGVMMFETLCNTRLFEGDSTDKVMRLNKKAKIPEPRSINPQIPEALEAIMLRALERDPVDRFPTLAEMLTAMNDFLPNAEGMQLAVAALLRKLFWREYMQELQLREGLKGFASARGTGQTVAIYSQDARANAAFTELLQSRGYKVELFTQHAALITKFCGHEPPQVALVDANHPELLSGLTLGEARKKNPSLPILVFSETLNSQCVTIAHQLGAAELLFKPFNIEQILAGVRAALTGTLRSTRVDTGPIAGVTRARLLLISTDNVLVETFGKSLAGQPFELEVCRSPIDALDRALQSSYQAVIYDVPNPALGDSQFIGQFRAQPGMGLVPAVYLSGAEHQAAFGNVEADRSAFCPRNANPAQIVQCVDGLRNDTRLGRTFVRYATRLPAEVRYGGRVFNAEAFDVSRGGLMLRCQQMTPVGTSVSVTIKLNQKVIEVNGRVVRVDPPKEGENDSARIGLEFERFAGRSEADLIAFISGIEKPAALLRKQTVILGAPPPVRPN